MPVSLARISVGGGDLVNEDGAWGGTADNRIFYWSSALNRCQEMPSPEGDPIDFAAVRLGAVGDTQAYRLCGAWAPVVAPPWPACA